MTEQVDYKEAYKKLGDLIINTFSTASTEWIQYINSHKEEKGDSWPEFVATDPLSREMQSFRKGTELALVYYHEILNEYEKREQDVD